MKKCIISGLLMTIFSLVYGYFITVPIGAIYSESKTADFCIIFSIVVGFVFFMLLFIEKQKLSKTK